VQPQPLDDALDRARAGDPSALSDVLAGHAPRLERMVRLRVDPRRARHFEPADVVQDALVEATRRFGEWCALPGYPFYTWLRLLTAQALSKAERRQHQQKRDVGRDRSLEADRSGISAAGTADWLVSTHTSPTQAARRAELCDLVQAALETLDELDREVLALRHFEQLSNKEAAAELGIAPAAASKRFARALQRLRPALRALQHATEPA